LVSFNLVDFYHGLKHLVGVDTMSLTGEEIVATLTGLMPGFEQGALTPPIVQTWPFAEAVSAYEAVAKGSGRAKQVLVMT
jgi:NADPH:quinone reductase-like Zn-dependent oxidoreductase